MKRTPFIALFLFSCATPLWAQSTVTVYGIVDLAVRNVRNEGVGSTTSEVSGSNNTSRIGFRGSEDLGGGWGAAFGLEHGLLADSGASASDSRFFDRLSTVSLTNKSLGELRLGRDYVPTYRNWSRFDPFSYVGVARSANFVSATPQGPIRAAFGTNDNTTVRSDNAIQYLLPKGLGGAEGEVLVALREGGLVTDDKANVLGARLGFTAGPVFVSAAHATTENSQTTVGKFKDTALGTALELGNVKLSAAWRRFAYDSAKQANLLIGLSAEFGVHEIRASWNRVDLSGSVGTTAIDNVDANQYGIGYVYNFSKRTMVYATFAQISNDSGARFTIPGGPSGIAAGGSSRGFETGLWHRF